MGRSRRGEIASYRHHLADYVGGFRAFPLRCPPTQLPNQLQFLHFGFPVAVIRSQVPRPAQPTSATRPASFAVIHRAAGPQHMREFRRVPRSRSTGYGPRPPHYARPSDTHPARRQCADCSPISVLRLSNWPTSTAATGDGIRAPSRSHFSRAARTCSGSTTL